VAPKSVGGAQTAESTTPSEDSAGESGFTIKGEAPKAMAIDPSDEICSERLAPSVGMFQAMGAMVSALAR
jgi:hypothetical protein